MKWRNTFPAFAYKKYRREWKKLNVFPKYLKGDIQMEATLKMVNNVEELDVAQIMSVDAAREAADKIEAAMSADPEINAMIESTKSVEDVFAVVKKFIDITLDEFKVVFQKTVDWFTQDKAVVADEMLDSVSGGGFWGNLWDKIKKPVVAIGIIVASTAAGAGLGAAVGGFLGAPVGAVGGLVVGIIAGVRTACSMK